MSKSLDGDDPWDAALRQAVDWSILLDDDPEDGEHRARFDGWLAADPLHRRAWDESVRVSGLIGQTRAVTALPVRNAAKAGRGRRPLVWAATAVAAAIAWFAAPLVLLHASADYVTGTARQQTVMLDDGSQVRLAPRSAIRVAYAGDGRHVDLLAGEAYFEAAPDPSRPFRVTARSAEVTVLGTGFDVRLGDAGAEVAVRHGRVRVDDTDREPSDAAILTAGQWARLSPDGPPVRGEVPAEIVGGWSDRRITAIDRPLSEVVADLRRYYGGRIILTGHALGGRSVTGVFDVRDPVEAARAIVKPHGGVVRSITPWLLVISASS